MAYHVTGIIMAALFGLTVYGLWCQLKKILVRRAELLDSVQCKGATSIISLNFIGMAFLAFYLTFFYGFALERFNHYLVWPRLFAVALTLLILKEMWRDRADRLTTTVFFLACLATTIGLLILAVDRTIAVNLQPYSQASILLITVLMGQANIHQITLVIRLGDTGSISLRAHQMTLIKDIGTIAFGFAMGSSGWPLIALCGTDAVFKTIMMYLFYWVRTSKVANNRRELALACALVEPLNL